MAALRSGMAMLARRSFGCSGSSSAASMGRKGMEMHQVFRPASPSLRPSAVRNLESWRRFSTEGGKPRDKGESFSRLLWQWAKYRVKNADPLTKSKAVSVYGVVVMGAPVIWLMTDSVRNQTGLALFDILADLSANRLDRSGEK